ncbi:hypothetical protein PCC7418_1743 [Halothece sp. PCC 7418]|uniref:hypothetical protein n=1 Tax=Halothece sp. (strain PCC 7418) TaxID=65093 RepID=UPI0002A0706F|nr:hypothetical protein [Halothece sp. PCC 7418]AFZ43912.1 hypothetical protein PCC7418_1743 [Halothece sp. PCC 7418]
MELNPPPETLITEIIAVNHAWKQVSEQLLDHNAGLALSLRDLKSNLQLRLLRNYPQTVYLVLDEETESEEPLYSVRLREPINGHWNAAHLPVRVAEEMLTEQELTQLIQRKNSEEF